jgi:hypothetical protein
MPSFALWLIGLELTDIKGSLAQFQATRSSRKEVKKLIITINSACEASLADGHLDGSVRALVDETRKTIPGSAIRGRPDEAASALNAKSWKNCLPWSAAKRGRANDQE